MYQIRKHILAFALAFAGISGANAQDPNMTPDNLAAPEEQMIPGDQMVTENQTAPESLMTPENYEATAENRFFSWQFAGRATAPKFVVQRFDFEPRFFFQRIYGVRVIGLDNIVDIRQAQLVLRNGQVVNLNNLDGFLNEGRVRRQFFNGIRIREVRIFATSPNPIGSRGDFRVDFLVWR